MRLRGFILKNLRLKFLALIVAVFFWALIVGSQRKYEEHTFRAVVEVVNLKEKYEVLSIYPEELRVVLGGYRSAFRKYPLAKDLVLKIDLSNVSGGRRFNFFAEDYLRDLPKEIKLISVYPRMIEIEVEEFVTQQLPVQVKFIGKLPEKCFLKEWKIEPEKINALVARNNLRQLKNVQTVEVDLSEFNSSTTISVPLVRSTAIARFLDYQEVKLYLEIEKND